MVFNNCRMTIRRQGTTILSNFACQFEVPGLRERMMAVGAVFDARIFAEAGTDLHEGDVVELTALDDNVLPQVTKFRVDLVLSEPGPLQCTEVQLTGVEQ